jgi:hypothetical protein
MGDYQIRMQFDIEADRKTVLEALSSEVGVESWWSAAVEGDPGQAGGEFRISFPDAPEAFRFDVAQSTDQRVEWRSKEFPPSWVGTTIRWEVADHPDSPGTRLLFSHRDFDPDAEIIPVITPAWAQIIQRLKGYAETGQADPFFPG